MTRRGMERGIWASAIAVAAVVLAGASRGAEQAAGAPGAIGAEPRMPRTFAAESLAAAARAVVARDPFRLDRRPASVAYRAEMEGLPQAPPAPVAPRPALAVGGIVGGPRAWAALLTGLPGREGSVLVRAGDRFGELAIRSVGRDTVVVRGADTTWRLAVRRAW